MSPADVVQLHLARAYLVDCGFFLADEPFAGLDANDVAHCVAILNELRDRGTGIVVTDHNWKPLLACADTAHVMQDGAIVYSDTAAAARVSSEARRLYFRSRE
jgi:ABC-type lipopolysaccharide export system ATPase subunit